MISNLEYRQGAPVEGVFRTHSPICRLARNNSKYLACVLKDRSGIIHAYAWFDRYQGVQLEEKTLMNVSGSMRWFADRWCVDLYSAVSVNKQADDPFLYLPDDYSPIEDGITRLSGIIALLRIQPLQEFMLNVLRDDRIVLPFLELSASHNHHHAYAGGLLEHSLECAEYIIRAAGTWDDQTELAACAALLHDIGKVRTLNRATDRWTGALLGHDLLTLELLAQPLAQLDQSWQDGAIALRYLLSWKLQERSGKRPLMTAVEMLQAADRISCGKHNEALLFGESPEWKRLVSDGAGRKFWRPRRLIASAA